MKLLIIIALLSFIGCKQENKKQTVVSDKQQQEVNNIISDKLIDYINSSLPDYTILTITDYFNEVNNFIDNGELPYICESDFDSDGKMEYAVLLKKGDHKLCIMIISLLKNKHQEIDCFNFNNKVDIILSVEKKGKWEAVDETIDVPNDGILVDFAKESLSKAYYWDGKKYVEFLYD